MMNIGVHFVDALIHIFGPASFSVAHLREYDRAAGFLVCGRATVRWFLSVNRDDLPLSSNGSSAYRSITLDGEAVDLSNRGADLHTRSYREIVAGRGLDLRSVRPSIEFVAAFNSMPVAPRRGERHPFVQRHAAATRRYSVQGFSNDAPMAR
jgi:UDP-N-acetyl-2-amino-2-deoxyglucuronate dehydrogenase